MPLPSSTTVLIVGAGPVGVSAALSLINQGIRDIVLVDAIQKGENLSRALAVHAATLDALDKLGCAEEMVKRGNKAKMALCGRTSRYLSPSFEGLAAYTRFPFILILPQWRTEEILNNRLETLGVQVFRPFRAVGLTPRDDVDGVNVSFESGEVIHAKYVIAADGSKSATRQLLGIGFSDPEGLTQDQSVNDAIAQLVIADVTFTDPGPPFPKDEMRAISSPHGLFLYIPTAETADDGKQIIRLGFNVPHSKGAPPSHPSQAYIQENINQHGPPLLSSDASVNPTPIQLDKVLWATRFRTHAAIADTFFTRVPSHSGERGGIVMLVGDSAHIHSPAGGQGMNLGIRDAVGLGPVIAAHIRANSYDDTSSLQEYAKQRRSRALHVIRTTKNIMIIGGALTSKTLLPILYVIFTIISLFSILRRRIAWNLSGLGNG